jgi:hypothetical protein
MENPRRERFLSPTLSARSIRLIIGERERWRTLLLLVLSLLGIPAGMISYFSMLSWAYGVNG